MRTAQIARKTNETDIQLSLNLDGRGESSIESGVGFLDHMLTLLSRHGRMDLKLTCRGDTYVDDHHSVEDVGIALGQAFAQALGDKRGVKRYASLCLPMDEALILCAVDLSGRGGYYEDLDIPTEKIGTFDTSILSEGQYFFYLDVFERELAGAICLDKPNQEFAFEITNTDRTLPEWAAGWGHIHFPAVKVRDSRESAE